MFEEKKETVGPGGKRERYLAPPDVKARGGMFPTKMGNLSKILK